MYVQSMYKSGTGSDAPKAVLHQKWVSLNGIAGATYIKSCQIWKFDKTLLKLPYTQIFDFSEGVVQSKKFPKLVSHTNQAKIVTSYGILQRTR